MLHLLQIATLYISPCPFRECGDSEMHVFELNARITGIGSMGKRGPVLPFQVPVQLTGTKVW